MWTWDGALVEWGVVISMEVGCCGGGVGCCRWCMGVR